MHVSWSRIAKSSSAIQGCLAFTCNRSTTWLEYFKKDSVSEPPIGIKCKHIQIMSGTYHIRSISYEGYPKKAIGCVFTFLHKIHTCEYGPTSWFAHLMGSFLAGRAFFGTC